MPQEREVAGALACSCLLQVAEIAEAAFECWWQDQHPGWMIFTLGNNHFESLDQIIKVHPACSNAMMSSQCSRKMPAL